MHVCCVCVFLLAPVVSTAYTIHFPLKQCKPRHVNKKSRGLGSHPYLKLTPNLLNVAIFSSGSLTGIELLCKWRLFINLETNFFQEKFLKDILIIFAEENSPSRTLFS